MSCRPAAALALQRVVLFQRRSLWMMQMRRVLQLLQCVKHATSQRQGLVDAQGSGEEGRTRFLVLSSCAQSREVFGCNDIESQP